MSRAKAEDEQREFGEYHTPHWPVYRLLDYVGPRYGHIIEPCAGWGNIIDAFLIWHKEQGKLGNLQTITAIDIQRKFEATLKNKADVVFIGSVLSLAKNRRVTHPRRRPQDKTKFPYSTLISNPPYNKAFKIVKEMRHLTRESFWLLRLNWLEGQDRWEFLQDDPPTDVYVLPNRPSFDDDGTDATAYAWMRWGQYGDGRRGTRLHILNLTTLAERKSDPARSST